MTASFMVLALLVACVAAQTPEPSKCQEELAKDCGGAKQTGNQTICHDCIRAKSKYITGCTVVEEIQFCEPKSCVEALEHLCSTARRTGNTTQCDLCVRKHLVELEKYNCDPSDARAFCANPNPGPRPPPPAPPARLCYEACDKLCGRERADKAKCTHCTVENAFELETKGMCDAKELIEFCNPPAPGPETCIRVLAEECASSRAKGPETCATCIFLNAKKLQYSGCNGDEEASFCGV